MNVGHEEEELKPYTEPEPDFNDTKRIGEDFEKNVASGEHRQFYLGRQTKTLTDFTYNLIIQVKCILFI